MPKYIILIKAHQICVLNTSNLSFPKIHQSTGASGDEMTGITQVSLI